VWVIFLQVVKPTFVVGMGGCVRRGGGACTQLRALGWIEGQTIACVAGFRRPVLRADVVTP